MLEFIEMSIILVGGVIILVLLYQFITGKRNNISFSINNVKINFSGNKMPPTKIRQRGVVKNTHETTLEYKKRLKNSVFLIGSGIVDYYCADNKEIHLDIAIDRDIKSLYNPQDGLYKGIIDNNFRNQNILKKYFLKEKITETIFENIGDTIEVYALFEFANENLSLKKIIILSDNNSYSLNFLRNITKIDNLMYQNNNFEKLTFEEAKRYSNNLRLGYYNDWRLPTLEELLKIGNIKFYGQYDDNLNSWYFKNSFQQKSNSKGNSYFLKEDFLENMPNEEQPYFWCSQSNNSSSILVNFTLGYNDWEDQKARHYILSVRDIQC